MCTYVYVCGGARVFSVGAHGTLRNSLSVRVVTVVVLLLYVVVVVVVVLVLVAVVVFLLIIRMMGRHTLELKLCHVSRGRDAQGPFPIPLKGGIRTRVRFASASRFETDCENTVGNNILSLGTFGIFRQLLIARAFRVQVCDFSAGVRAIAAVSVGFRLRPQSIARETDSKKSGA